MTDALDTDAIRARLAAATPGPWKSTPIRSANRGYSIMAPNPTSDNPGDIVIVAESIPSPDMITVADFIAAAPTDIAALLAEVGRLRDVMRKILVHDLAGRRVRFGSRYVPNWVMQKLRAALADQPQETDG